MLCCAQLAAVTLSLAIMLHVAGTVSVESIAWRETAPVHSCSDAFELKQLGGMKLWTKPLSELLGGRRLKPEGACLAGSFIGIVL